MADGSLGRILVFTGARQTGKTTLTKHIFSHYTYLSIEDPVLRAQYAKLSAPEWNNLYPLAILDEVQKEPLLVESIKAVYDQWPGPRYVLLGSSQLLLLEKVKESLAGRCVIIELFPLTIPELLTKDWTDPVEDSPFQRYISRPETPPELLPSFLLDKRMAEKKAAWDHYVRFGGYPALTKKEMTDAERYTWLRAYVRTYLERDIRDLASFRDLEPFIKLQQYLALQTGQIINASSIAAQLGLSVKTVQRYIRYFELSYQAITLPAWSRNQNKRLTRAPKLHYLDNGVLQAVLRKRGGVSGGEFESLVTAEIYKQLRCLNADVDFYHLRTHDGFEIDLLIETERGYVAFEIKMSDKIRPSDAAHLKKLPALLDKPLLGGFLLSQDNETRELFPGIFAVHAAYFLG
ncbi:MAG: AAA family ATPase [Spirochaetales bacterium]|jgi:predicted AAA+ superfamily ATPase|nr:AAA family ATPase [Spirochaetales bacterium]